MASTLTALSTTDEIAQLAGLFNWQMSDASFTNVNHQKVSFHVITQQQIPATRYIAGEINTYNLITGPGNRRDPNLNLFNTFLNIDGLNEDIDAKFAINRVPFANYDQLVPLGVGGEQIIFNVAFCGILYLTAMRNVIQGIFGNNNFGLGKLNHPFYDEIDNVLPIRVGLKYESRSLNCVVMQLIFRTSDLSHLSAGISSSKNTAQTIQEWFIGTQNAASSIGGTISSAQALSNNVGGAL